MTAVPTAWLVKPEPNFRWHFCLKKEEAEHVANNMRTYANGCTGATIEPLYAAPVTPQALTEGALTIEDYEEVLADKRRLTRELDVAMHGEEGAAKQASLCDLIPLAKKLRAALESAERKLEEQRKALEDRSATPGAEEAFAALDIADRLIERGYGDGTPKEWDAAYRKVAKARARSLAGDSK